MRKALVVGIDNYPGAPLNGCVNDAHGMSSVLESHGDGSPNFKVKIITSPSKTVTRASLKAAITDLFSGDADIALLYFSGHGIVTGTGGYIVTPDFQRYDEGVSMDEILVLANASKCRDRLVLLDCCHSGKMGTPQLGADRVSHVGDGLTVLTASRDWESAVEVDGQGVFTALLIDALKGGAADVRGHISPGGIYAYVDQALDEWAQRPVFKTNVSRFTSVRTVPPLVAHETLRKLPVYFPDPQDEFLLDPSYEFTETAANPDHVAIFKDLQKFERVGLVVPVGTEHMYYAATESRSCRLTAAGYHYWRMAKEKKF